MTDPELCLFELMYEPRGCAKLWACLEGQTLNDAQLAAVIRFCAGETGHGWSNWPNRADAFISPQNLQVWVGRERLPLRYRDTVPPTFKGQHTVDTVRRLFDIRRASGDQLSLLEAI